MKAKSTSNGEVPEQNFMRLVTFPDVNRRLPAVRKVKEIPHPCERRNSEIDFRPYPSTIDVPFPQRWSSCPHDCENLSLRTICSRANILCISYSITYFR